MGPKLFILYINDICNVSDKVKFILFADDTNLFCSDVNLVNLIIAVNNELEKLCIWFAMNKLSLNVTKTNYMIFNKRKKVSNLSVKMNNCNINRVYATKFLDVIIDEDLNWKEHILYVKSKISKNIFILYRARKLFNDKITRILYCSLILPYFTYCVEIWGNTYKTNLNTIIMLQKKSYPYYCWGFLFGTY